MQAIVAGINITLLLTVPVAVFVGVAAASVWVIMAAGIAITVADSVRTTRDDGLRTLISDDGRLHAYVSTRNLISWQETASQLHGRDGVRSSNLAGRQEGRVTASSVACRVWRRASP